MKVLLQRVLSASVTVDGEVISAIENGLLLFVGIEKQDDEYSVAGAVKKVLGFRIFADDAGKMNQSVLDVGGDILVVSQFTLAADTSAGRRPSFSTAADPVSAKRCYEDMVGLLRQSPLRVETGRFAADMRVALVNDGPVTFLLSS